MLTFKMKENKQLIFNFFNLKLFTIFTINRNLMNYVKGVK